MNKGTILVIDDDSNLQMVIQHYLEDDGYKVLCAGDSASALEKLELGSPDVILLDLVLPDGEGVNLIPRFRAMSNAVIIVVSGKSETMEKIICLEMGADDYMTKPFEMRELSARIKAARRRMAPPVSETKTSNTAAKEDKIFFNDGWCLDRTQYQLLDNTGRSADLTTGEFKLLEALILSANRALSREQLFDLTREGRFDAFDRAIDIQITRIRRKLQDDTKSPSIIKTVRGVGYMFCGNIAA